MSTVVVIGAGNAGLCAALAARQAGAHVVVIERATEEQYCSDSVFTGGMFRLAYEHVRDLQDIVGPLDDAILRDESLGAYPKDAFLSDWGRVTGYRCDLDVAELVVEGSYDGIRWLAGLGVPFDAGLVVDGAGQVRHSRPAWHGGFVEVSGAGIQLMESLFAAAATSGVDVEWGTAVTGVEPDAGGWLVHGRRHGVTTASRHCDAVILAAGGFQGDPEWRTRCLGPGWDLARLRGCAFNTGLGLQVAFAAGARSHGNWSGCHAVAWSVGAGEAGNRDANHVFERESYPFGITVNVHGERFVDEGQDFGGYTYARYGKEILRQPEQRAWQLFDASASDLLLSEYRYKNPEAARVRSDTLEGLAAQLASRGVDAGRLLGTVAEFNGAVDQRVPFRPYALDGKATSGLAVNKSNWAQPLETAPFEAYEVTCGITFTFGGLRVDTSARVLNQENEPIPGLFACGEIVGGLYYFNYPGGTGLTSGTVLGRIAGRLAAG